MTSFLYPEEVDDLLIRLWLNLANLAYKCKYLDLGDYLFRQAHRRISRKLSKLHHNTKKLNGGRK